jgi:DeoR/GlpR family transcriptional regulator of sugar metabolism
MLSVERKQRILDYLASQKSAQVNELSGYLDVSLATIRRDLQELENQGSLRRVHGGAVIVNRQTEPPILLRRYQQAEFKQCIGAAAAALFGDNETIFLASGTTTEAIIPFLVDKLNLTVITNAINIAQQLIRCPQISTIVLGGWLRHSELSLLGHLTEQALQDLRADRLFLGVFGIDPDYGLTGSDVQEVQTDRQIISIARELIVLADHTKFGKVGNIRLAPMEAVSTVVTDQETPAAQVEALQNLGIRVIIG